MIATQITTHKADAQARLLEQYKNKPVLAGIIDCLVSEVQAFEDAAFPIVAARQLVFGTAEGQQLDGIGALIGLPRNGVGDAEYKTLIFGTIAQNYSNGANETLLRLARLVFEASSAAVISPFSPGHASRGAAASVGVEVGDAQIDPTLYALVIGILQKSIAATVGLSWVSTYSGADAFAFDGPNKGLGFDDLTSPGTGGALASLIYSATGI